MNEKNTEPFKGGCLCGRIRWQAAGIPMYTYHCHCKMCQRSSGATFITSAAFDYDQVSWSGDLPRAYKSSEHASRLFCPHCGSWLAWQWRNEKVSLLAGCFDNPEHLAPDAHVFFANHIPWMELTDDLPRHNRYPHELEHQDPELEK